MSVSFEEWVHYVDNLPHFKRRLEIARMAKLKNNSFLTENRFLYKFMPLVPDNEQLVDRVKDVLVKSRLWLSSPVDFNDPFDSSIKITISPNIQEQRERINNMLKEKGVRYTERKKRVLHFARKSESEREKILNNGYQNSLKKIGIFSFAGKLKNNLMWSHYANNHSGLCVQFERARDFIVLSSAVRVDYSTDYPVAIWGRNFEESLKNALLQKQEQWSYEQESRIIRPGWANKYLPIKPEAVVGIIMGCKSKEDHHKVMEEILDERRHAGLPTVQCYFVKKSTSGYNLSVFRK